MKNHHLLTLFTALSLLAGCGASAPSQRTTAGPAAGGDETVEVPGASWQSALSQPELGKIALPLWQWLDGDAPDAGDLLVDGESVQVTVQLRHELYQDEITHYERMGLVATEGDDAPSGRVTREQLLELARDHNVLELGAPRVASEPDADAETATARADDGSTTTAL